MASKVCKFVVYYRDLSQVIVSMVNTDGRMSIIKDGVHELNGVKIPRCTITVESLGPHKDPQRIEALDKLLENLAVNNQIAGYKKLVAFD